MDRTKRRPRSKLCLLLVGALTCVSLAQAQGTSQTAVGAQGLFNPLSFPIQLQGALMALGDRLQKPGKERQTFTGTLTNSGQNYAVRVTLELPNKVRIDGAWGTTRSVGFDGSKNWASGGSISDSDEDLLETLLEDSPEGMLFAVRRNAGLRAIATFARFDDGSTPNYKGPLVDILQVTGPTESRDAKTTRVKHYFFDSTTRLLAEVDYFVKRADGSTAAVRVQRSNWTTVNGEKVPGTVTRIENGQVALSLSTSSQSFAAAGNDGTFTGP